MRSRCAAVAAGVLLMAVGLAAPVARAAGVPGTTDFSASMSAHCLIVPDTGGFDATLVEAGAHPSSVTVGERIQVDFTQLTVPNASGPNSRVLQLHVSGPVTPNGDVTVYADDSGPFLQLKATAAGRVTIDLVRTQGSLVFRGTTYFTQCTPTAGTARLTSFTTTTKPVCLGVPATIVGASGNDVIHGTAGPDVVYAGSGDDVIDSRGGDDIVCGAHGNDTIDAGGDRDRVDGGYANDVVRGKQGNDWLDGGSGSDTLDGGTGTDSCRNGEVLVSC